MARPRRQMCVQADKSKVQANRRAGRQAGKQDDKQITKKTGMSSFMQTGVQQEKQIALTSKV